MAGERDRGRWPGDLHVGGTLSADEWAVGDNVVSDENISGDANISPLKVVQQYIHKYVQDFGAAVASKHSQFFLANGDGAFVSIEAGLVLPAVGDSTLTIVILKNNVTILSGSFILDSGDAARAMVAASIGDGDYLAGDFFEITTTASVGTGTLGQGLLVQAVVREAASA